MSVKLSRLKITKMFRYYFAGLTQTLIAQKLGVDQSTISLYAKEFNEKAAKIGLLETAKEYGVYTEVNELRNLAVELHNKNQTPEETRIGINIYYSFNKLKVPTEHHLQLIQVCKRINDPAFVSAAVEVSKLEKGKGISCEEAVPYLENVYTQIQTKKKEFEQIQVKFNSLTRSVKQVESEFGNSVSKHNRFKENAKAEREKLERDYQARTKQWQVFDEELKAVAFIKQELAKDGLDIPTFEVIVKEYRDGTGQIDGQEMIRDIQKHQSLKKSLKAQSIELSNKKQETVRSRNELLGVVNLNAEVVASLEQNKKDCEASSLESAQLHLNIKGMKQQIELFEGFIGVLKNSPSAKGPIESLTGILYQQKRQRWYSTKSLEQKMELFIKTVFGDFLQSYQCQKCGSKFMVARGTKSGSQSFYTYCPVCRSLSEVKPDDSFLRAFVSEEGLEDIRTAESLAIQNEQMGKALRVLFPFHKLLERPCEGCHQIITDWDQMKVEDIVPGLVWRHKWCQ